MSFKRLLVIMMMLTSIIIIIDSKHLGAGSDSIFFASITIIFSIIYLAMDKLDKKVIFFIIDGIDIKRYNGVVTNKMNNDMSEVMVDGNKFIINNSFIFRDEDSANEFNITAMENVISELKRRSDVR